MLGRQGCQTVLPRPIKHYALIKKPSFQWATTEQRGLGFEFWGLGLRVWGLGFWGWGLGLGFEGFAGSNFRALGLSLIHI